MSSNRCSQLSRAFQKPNPLEPADRGRYLLQMADTTPQPRVGSDDERNRIRRVISDLGLVGAANDEKWGRLLDAMRQHEGWRPSYRFKCVDGQPSGLDVEWWYHLPFPMMSIEWFDISYLVTTRTHFGSRYNIHDRFI